MVKVIMGLKGSGKTKTLIELIKKAAVEETGNTVCISTGSNMTYDIPYSVRLIDATNYNFNDIEFLKGFLSGLHAGNYDITHVFIDGLLKLADFKSEDDEIKFLYWCEKLSEKENVKFTITISADVETASPDVKRFL